jgi:uncharacterized protein (DUF1501 family)
MVPPIGDPQFASIRGPWLEAGPAPRKISSDFALAPQLSTIAGMYEEGDVLPVHAVATAYRERSHFDAQNLLETGGTKPYALRDGWLNRLLGILEGTPSHGLAIAPTIPAALQGSQPVTSYAPNAIPDAEEDFLTRIASLYPEDSRLQQAWEAGIAVKATAGDLSMKNLKSAADAGALAARLMLPQDGARIAMIDLPGWDTHAQQLGRLARGFAKLDALVGAFRDGISTVWQDTLVVVVTEFGRTVAINGTGGTDHGTGAAGFLLGGSVRGGRVLADWPGLASAALYDGRDLRPTTSLEMLLAGTLAEHFALDPERTAKTLFPGRPTAVIGGLIAT